MEYEDNFKQIQNNLPISEEGDRIEYNQILFSLTLNYIDSIEMLVLTPIQVSIISITYDSALRTVVLDHFERI